MLSFISHLIEANEQQHIEEKDKKNVKFPSTEDIQNIVASSQLPDWVIHILLGACSGNWNILCAADQYIDEEMNNYLNFDNGPWLNYRMEIEDVMLPSLIQCLDLFGDFVQKLSIAGNKVSSKGIEMLLDSFTKRNAKYKSIYFADNCLDDQVIPSLGRYIQSNKHLKEISFGNGITNKGIERLFPYVAGNTVLRKLDLRKNTELNDHCIPLLIKMIESSSIQNIHVEGTSITQESIFTVSLIQNIIKYESENLNLQYWNLSDEDLIKICEPLGKYDINKWKQIDLRYNKLSSKGVSVLFATLKKSKSKLSQIILERNHINDECMKALGEFVHSNQYLQQLNLGYNDISDRGIEILAPYIEGNTVLEYVNLVENNKITNRSIAPLFKVIEASHITNIICGNTANMWTHFEAPLLYNQVKRGVVSLDFYQRNLKEAVIVKLIEYFERFGVNNLKEILLDQSEITIELASRLFHLLEQKNVRVQRFSLFAKQFDEEYVRNLGEFLESNQYFDSITIDNWQFGDKHMKILTEYLIGNTKLRSIEFPFNQDITDASVPYLIEIAKNSLITTLHIENTRIWSDYRVEIKKYLSIPIDKREICIKSKTKSAAKR